VAAPNDRLRLNICGGTAAVVVIALLVVVLPRGSAVDRAVTQPVEGVLQAEDADTAGAWKIRTASVSMSLLLCARR
jgi:hypothetical protein